MMTLYQVVDEEVRHIPPHALTLAKHQKTAISEKAFLYDSGFFAKLPVLFAVVKETFVKDSYLLSIRRERSRVDVLEARSFYGLFAFPAEGGIVEHGGDFGISRPLVAAPLPHKGIIQGAVEIGRLLGEDSM